ncbi:MAG: NusG domain II-containing protein [Candidatus Omnitrophica bacterium]|nr:NusG domain II-containing protein [Candidatus Omnitrophota bacterium]
MKDERKEHIDLLNHTKCDLILILTIILVIFSALAFQNFVLRKQPCISTQKALIFLENGLLREINLKENKELYLPEAGIRVETKDGKVRIIESDCPGQICVHSGWIQYAGQSIVCVPNKIFIEIQAAAGKQAVDSKQIDILSF